MRITIFDTETTGLPVREGKLEQQPYVTQFASQTFDYDPKTRRFQEISRFNQLVKPPISIPEDCIRISGITDAMVADKPTFAQISEQVLAIFKNSDLAVAHNLSFDQEILGFEMERLGLSKNFLPATTYDTLEGTRNLCKLPGKTPGSYKAPKLMELHQFLLNEGFQEAHNAEKDVEALSRCVRVLLQNGIYQPVLAAPIEVAVEQASLF